MNGIIKIHNSDNYLDPWKFKTPDFRQKKTQGELNFGL